ncbi:MAG: PQQ-dependent sugar dehydrogenase, partial [Bacteroidota bacterium]
MRSWNSSLPKLAFQRPSILYVFLGIVLMAAIPMGIQQSGLFAPEPAQAYLNTFPTATPGTGGTGAWVLEDVYPAYTFNSPMHMQEEPGSNRIMVAEKLGRIQAFDKTSNSGNKTTFLDLTDVDFGGESGLLCFAFHPQYATDSPYCYVFYQYKPGGSRYTRVSRFELDNTGTALDPASEMVLIHEYDRAGNHNGGPLFFGADGFLYIFIGDEGGSNNTYNNCQALNQRLFGGVLRIDVDRDPTQSHPILFQSTAGNGSFKANYLIPNSNPWQDPTGNAHEEFVAIGLRNPHRASYDPPTGNIWIGDVGQVSREEVNVMTTLGANFQWAFKEASLNGPDAQPGTVIGTSTPPIHEYAHASGNNCIVGGYVYRGAEHTDLQGKYIFADNGGKRVWAMELSAGPNPTAVQVDQLMTLPFGASYFSISAFSTDANGELYVIRMNGNASPGGKIYKLDRQNPGAPEPPALLSNANIFQTITPTTLTPEDYLIPYDLNQPFWSDGALKYRWLVIPNDGTHDTPAEKINYTNKGDWDMPPGAVLVKHF